VLISLDRRSRLLMRLPTAHRLRAALREVVRNYGDALREAFVLYREYQHLTSNRIPSDEALRKVFGLDQVRKCCWTESRRQSWTTKTI
jgi:hypothetical protein